LVTEGADLGGSRLPAADKVYVAPGVVASAPAQSELPGADWLLDIGQLNLREPALDSVQVRGYGLEQEQWASLSGHPQINFEAPGIKGFTGMRWQRFLSVGEMLHISGQYGQDRSDGIVQLRLLDPARNTVADGRFKNGQNFRLMARVKTRGTLEYTLQAWAAGKLQSEQILPIDAGAGNRLNIMIVQSAPSFETRQLKDFAAANGHRVRINTDISKGKYINQSVNLPEDADTTFSPQVLAEQDILIMDGRAFATLPALRRQWLSDAVQSGLGLLLLADSSLLAEFEKTATTLLDGFGLTSLSGAEPRLIPRLITGGGQRDWQEPVAVAAMQLSADDADVLIDGNDGRDLVVRRSSGLGQIGISLISHSHSWLTAGHRTQWSDYWSALLSALSRQRGDSFLLPPAETAFYRVDQRTPLCALTTNSETSIVVGDTGSTGQHTTLELQAAADMLQSPRRCAFFWPRARGWHKVQLLAGSDGAVLDQKAIYVFAADQWLAQQRDQRVKATRTRAADGKVLPSSTENPAPEPLSVFWLWLTLVVSASLLWLERKLDFG
ncbi:MAG: hypothetical protein WBS20_17515, partial [Lysobacterales bacterium]